jgi:hypothetical protein
LTVFGLDVEIADDVDALASSDVFEGDPGATHGVDVADRRPVQHGDGAARPPEEDRGQRIALIVACPGVDVEDDLPLRGRLDVVAVAQR